MVCRASRSFFPVVFFITLSGSVISAEFFVDPVKGDNANDGSAARPWQSLQGIIDAGMVESRKWEKLPYKEGAELVPLHTGAKIKPGDTIWLRSGDHGSLKIQGHYNSKAITLTAAKGETPRFTSIQIRSGSHWALRGLHVSPDPDAKKTTLIDLQSHGWSGPVSDISVEECVLSSTEDSSGWTAEDWNRRACTGIGADGTRVTIRNNRLRNVDTGINVGASHALVEHNVVENFCGDGMRGLGSHSVFQFNTVKNCYDVNDNHDDAFQSWSTKDRKPGGGVITDIVLRGNTFINYVDPDQPHRGPLQGIGCFDGIYDSFVIENNLIVVDHYHGITLLGARNCRIVNNTVIDPNSSRPGPPWIMIGPHKRGEASGGCVIRNNLVSASANAKSGENIAVDHNLQVKDPAAFFAAPDRGDFRLKPGSPAIDAGSPELGPETDIAGTPRPEGAAVDLGAYERK